ncbi:RluA family pseudouridine synthase [bacterium]|nr:RluA family pseudouridine synthase [bacterium]
MALREIVISTDDAGQRLDAFLNKVLDAVPHSVIYRWLRTKKIKVNGARTSFNYRLEPGDRVSLFIPRQDLIGFERESSPTFPAPLPPIIYRDDQILVLNKPAGLAVHGGSGVSSDHLAARVLAWAHSQPDRTRSLSYAPSPVHRLDRETSGLIVFGLTRQAQVVMARQIREHQWTKIYLAALEGRITPDQDVIDLPLEHKPGTSQRPAQPARTHYWVLDQNDRTSFVRIQLETGRFRQIRRHFSQCGFPLIGDSRYASPPEKPDRHSRLFLHAYRLEFPHPASGRDLSFTAPLPDELIDLLNRRGFKFKDSADQP